MSDFMFENVFKILNDHFQLPDGEDVLQSTKGDREQEQEDKETDTNYVISFSFHLYFI